MQAAVLKELQRGKIYVASATDENDVRLSLMRVNYQHCHAQPTLHHRNDACCCCCCCWCVTPGQPCPARAPRIISTPGSGVERNGCAFSVYLLWGSRLRTWACVLLLLLRVPSLLRSLVLALLVGGPFGCDSSDLVRRAMCEQV